LIKLVVLEEVVQFENMVCPSGTRSWKGWEPLPLMSSLSQAVYAKTPESQVALHTNDLGTESGRELFKGSKDAASLLVCNLKNNFWLCSADFSW